MTIELKFSTNIREAVRLIQNGEVNPILDWDNTRYSIDIAKWDQGKLRWTPFDLTTQERIGDVTYLYSVAAHATLSLALIGPMSTTYMEPAITATFPNYPVPVEFGTVTP